VVVVVEALLLVAAEVDQVPQLAAAERHSFHANSDG